MIIGTGIDIVEIDRIREAHSRWGDRFIDRIFAQGEVEGAGHRADKYPYLAARFAAKEAFLKALGTGLSMGVSWKDIEVKREKGQRPFFCISGRAGEILAQKGAKEAHLSISHEKRYAVAQVILEG